MVLSEGIVRLIRLFPDLTADQFMEGATEDTTLKERLRVGLSATRSPEEVALILGYLEPHIAVIEKTLSSGVSHHAETDESLDRLHQVILEGYRD